MSITEDTIRGIQQFTVKQWHNVLKETNEEIDGFPQNKSSIQIAHKQKLKDITINYFTSVLENWDVCDPVDNVFIDERVQAAYDRQLLLGLLEGNLDEMNPDIAEAAFKEYPSFIDLFNTNYNANPAVVHENYYQLPPSERQIIQP